MHAPRQHPKDGAHGLLWTAAVAAWAQVEHHVPALRWLPAYKVSMTLVDDVVAAVAEVVVAVPEALSYASIAGLPAVNGLYSAMLGPIVYAGIGSSLQLVTGPTAIMSILTRAAIPSTWGGHALVAGSDAYVRVAAALAATVGVLQLVMYFARAGALMRLMSHPVMLGFVSASAFLVASTQLANLLGLPKCVGDYGGSCNVPQAISNVQAFGKTITPASPLASLGAIAFLILFKFLVPRLLPPRAHVLRYAGPLIVVIVGCAVAKQNASVLLAAGISSVGAIPAGLPVPQMPFPLVSPASGDVAALLLGALPPAIIGYMESLAIARAVGRQFAYTVDAGQELFAVGVANVAVALGQGYPVTGSFSRTAVMSASGARSPVASLLAGLLVIPILLWATSLLAALPKVAPAAIILVVIGRLIQPREILALWRTDKLDFAVFLATFASIIASSLAAGLAVGIIGQWFIGLTRGFASRTTVQLLRWSSDKEGDEEEAHGHDDGVMARKLLNGRRQHPAARLAVAEPMHYPASAAAVSRGWRFIDISTPEDLLAAAPRVDGAPSDADLVELLARTSSGEPAAATSGGAIGVLIARPEPDLLFHNASRLGTHLSEALDCYCATPAAITAAAAAASGRPEAAPQVVLDLSRVNAADSTGVAALFDLADETLDSLGVHVAAAGASHAVVALILRYAVAQGLLMSASEARATSSEMRAPASAQVSALAAAKVHRGTLAGNLLLFETVLDAVAYTADRAAGTLLGMPRPQVPAHAAPPESASTDKVEGSVSGPALRLATMPSSSLSLASGERRHAREPLKVLAPATAHRLAVATTLAAAEAAPAATVADTSDVDVSVEVVDPSLPANLLRMQALAVEGEASAYASLSALLPAVRAGWSVLGEERALLSLYSAQARGYCVHLG